MTKKYSKTDCSKLPAQKWIIFFLSVLFSLSLSAQPAISSFSPASGPVGTTVTITGANFSTTPANNIVFFGAVKANVTTASANSLTVTVPGGSTYQPITVTTGGLTGYSARQFIATFTGGGQINSSCFSDRIDSTTDLHPNGIAIIDFDGDGKPDIATPNNYSTSGQPASISILRNTSSVAGIAFAQVQNINNGVATYTLAGGDIDGDGKQDIVACSIADFNISVFRSTSVVGNISFAPKVDYTTVSGVHGIAIRDIDGDGKPDITVVNHLSTSMSVYRNTSTPGIISFAPKVDFTILAGAESIVTGDMDGDSKPDIAITNTLFNSFSTFRNTSTAGNISFSARVDIATGGTNAPEGISIGDLDGDLKADVAVVITNNTGICGTQLYRNTSTVGSIAFNYTLTVTGVNGTTAYHATFGDINGDGKPDIAMSNTGADQVQVYQNNSTVGTLAFGSANSFPGIFGPYAVAIGDMNADGKPELVASEFTLDKVSVFKNSCGSPAVTSFTPVSAASGSTVTITGSNFTGITSVTFGGISATSFSVINSTTISAVVGTGASGNIAVTNSAGSGSKSGFQFAGPPVVNSFTPSSGFSGTTITISGLNFNGASTVRFGGTDASSFNVIDPFTIIATVAFGTTGSVSVTTPFGTGSLGGFTYAPVPIINSFTPTSAATGSTVTISGINFTGTTAVSFGGIAASSFTVVNSNTITAVIGNGASGNVVVTNAFGTHAMAGFNFLPPPTIISFNPVSAGSGTTVVVTGTNFMNVTAVKFGGVNANSFNVINSTTINAVVSFGSSGAVSVTAAGGIASLPGFTFIPAPTISSFLPAITGNGATVTITGTNLTGTTAVSFGGVAALSFTVINPTTVTAVVGSGATGNVSVTTGGGATLLPGFTYITNPVIHSFAPASGPVGTVVTITGANFNPVAANNIVYFGAVKATVSAGTANSITATVPTGASYQPITVTANNRTAFSFSPFTVTFAGGGAFNSNSFAGRSDFVTAGKPESIATGDLDGDGKPDVVVANTFSNTISIFRNTSTPSALSFAPKIDSAAGLNPHAVRIADIDGDGKLDIVLLNYNPSVTTSGPDNTISIFRNRSTLGDIAFDSRLFFTTSGSQIYINPLDLAIADLNLDGKPDLAVIHTNTYMPNGNPFMTTYGNTSTGTAVSFNSLGLFEMIIFPNQVFPFSISAADINLDSKPDLVVTVGVGTVVVMRNNSSIGAPSLSLSSQVVGNVIANLNQSYTSDFDGDGKIDIITENYFFKNTSTNNISFVLQAITGQGGILAIDGLSGSVKPDFARVNSAANTVSAVRNTSTVGLVSFDPGVNYNTGTSPRGVSIADFNGDGKVDIATCNRDFNTFSVLLNNAGFIGLSITSFSPANGNSGTIVTITGSNFTGVSGVSFGGVAASSFTVVNSTTITATISSGTSGNISVITAGGTASMGWFYYGPLITSFTPAISGTGLSVTITGSGFIGATSVSFGGIPASSFTIVSPTTIVAVVAAGSTGDVSVTTPGGTATLSGFTYAPAPTITSFNPLSGGAGTVVNITGTNFSGATQVRFGSAPASSFTVTSPTTTSAVVGAGATGNVFVTTPGGTANSINQIFTFIPAPTITSFTPISATSGATVTITGTNFTGTIAVSFGGIAAQSFTVNSATSISAVVGTGASGNISVTTAGGTVTMAGFTYTIATSTGNPSNNNTKDLTVNPNPGDGIVVIKHPASLKKTLIRFIDIAGRTVKEVTPARNTSQTSTDVKDLPQGIYKITWSDGKRLLSRTFMVK
jgi:hypothetical protein